MRFLVFALCAIFALTGCGAVDNIWASDEEVSRASYSHNGPTQLVLLTMLSNRTGAGAHTSLMINGSQRVMFDPAGSFKHETIPERHDVLYGITPPVLDVYTRYHARKTYHVKIQTLNVSPATAERAIALVKAYGAVPAAQCSKSTSTILSQVFPGQIAQTWYPKQLAEQFARLPGVTEKELYEYDDDDNSKVLAAWNPDKASPQPY